MKTTSLLFLSSVVWTLTACGEEGPPDHDVMFDIADEDTAEAGRSDAALFSCPLMNGSGSAGAQDVNLSVSSIRTQANSPVWTVYVYNAATGVTNSLLVSIANPATGVTFGGGWNLTNANARITSITSVPTALNVTGVTDAGATVTGQITISGGTFSSGGANGLQRVNRIWATSVGDVNITANPQSVPTSFTTFGFPIVRQCGMTASVTGTTGIITLSSPSVGQTSTTFLVDGINRGTDTTAPFSVTLDSALLRNGSHTLVVRGSDENTTLAQSASVLFSTTNPGPTMTASVTGGSGVLTLNATNTSTQTLSKVEFYIDGVLRVTDTTSPYSVTYNSGALINGPHNLVARGYNTAGNTGDSPSVPFTVANAIPVVTATATGTSGNLTLAATVTSPLTLARVEFLVDGVVVATDTTSPYSVVFNSRTIANGAHTLVARAFDSPGNVGLSPAVAFSTNNDFAAPVVGVPTFSGTSGSITFAVTATDVGTGITNVDFLLNNIVRASDTTSPYSAVFNSRTLANGTYTLTARARDAVGNVTTSSGVSLTLANDFTVPTVSLSFVPGTALGSYRFTANATDASGIAKVDFRVQSPNGRLVGTDTAAPYELDYSAFFALPNSTYPMYAIATDNATNTATASSSFVVSIPTFNEAANTTNGTIAGGETVPVGSARVMGQVSVTGTAPNRIPDTDVYKITVPAGKSLRATVGTVTTILNNYFDMDVRNASNVVLGSSTTTGLTDSVTVANTTGASTFFYVRVYSMTHLSSGYFIQLELL